MIHHFYAMGGAIHYPRTALKTVGDYIKTVLTPTNSVTRRRNECRPCGCLSAMVRQYFISSSSAFNLDPARASRFAISSTCFLGALGHLKSWTVPVPDQAQAQTARAILRPSS
jgi:hypothetical protein